MKNFVKFRKILFPALIAFTLVLSACGGGGGGGGSDGGGSIAVTGVSLKSSTSLLSGGNEQLIAEVTPSNATNKDVTWQSLDENIALVNSSGVVTGVNTGNTIIRVITDDGGYIADCMVTVTPNPVAVTGVSLNKTAINLYVNSSDQLTAAVIPSNATNQNVTWSSLNSSIASVNSTGFVTGISTGTTKVIATTADGYFQAECTVTVSESGIPADDLVAGMTAFANAVAGATTDNGSDYSNTYHVYVKMKNNDSSVRIEYEYVSDCSGDPLWGEGSYIFNNYTDSNGVIINGTLSYYIIYDGSMSAYDYVFEGTLAYSGTVDYNTEYNYMFSFDGSAMTYGGYCKIGNAYYSYNTNGSLATTPVTVVPSFTPPTKPTTEGCVVVDSVRYNGNGSTGGSVPVDTTNYTQGDTVTVLGNTGGLVNPGYVFTGWNTSSDGSGTTYTENQTFSMGAIKITLYAKWAAVRTVIYNGNGSNSGSVPVDYTDYIQGDIVTVKGNTGNLVTTQTQDGITFVFIGWNTSSDGSGTGYKPGASFTIGANSVTLYARWSLIGAVGPAGGLVFYDKGSYSGTPSWRYLEAAPQSIELTDKVWGGYNTIVSGADGTAVGTGYQNTIDIVMQYGDAEPYGGSTDYCAKQCRDLVYGGYSDWFMPSKDELNLMYTNLHLNGFGSFANDTYWSSSEYNAWYAWSQNFNDGRQEAVGKYAWPRLRAVRAF